MLRYCGIMAPNVEGAVTRARDSLDLRPVSLGDTLLVCPATPCMAVHVHCGLLHYPGYPSSTVRGPSTGNAPVL